MKLTILYYHIYQYFQSQMKFFVVAVILFA